MKDSYYRTMLVMFQIAHIHSFTVCKVAMVRFAWLVPYVNRVVSILCNAAEPSAKYSHSHSVVGLQGFLRCQGNIKGIPF